MYEKPDSAVGAAPTTLANDVATAPAGRPARDIILVNDIATAPGDLPAQDIIARMTMQAEQFRHDNTITPLAPSPDEPVLVEATSGVRLPLARATLFYTTDGRVPDTGDAAVPMTPQAGDWNPHSGFLTRWQATIAPQPAGTLVRYRIAGWRQDRPAAAGPEPDLWAHDGQGFWFRFQGPQGISTFAYDSQPGAPPLPGWAAAAVMYQVFVDRFHPGTGDGHFKAGGHRDIHGGTLAGVQATLPYLWELGVDCLWLSPICVAPSYHRYDATDLYRVDPAVGGDDALRALVDAAHAHQMRVILDFVPSHLSWKHPAFLAAQADRNAESFSWFTFYEWPNDYRSFLDSVRSLPSSNTEDPGARQHIIGSAVHWLREFGVDGFRIDHAIGPSMDFWLQLRRETAAVRPDVLLFGEVTDTPDSLRRYRGRLHGVLDFPLAQALRHTFALGDWNLARFASYLDAYEQYMAPGPGRLSFLDNHDMNRFLFLAHNDTTRLKLAALCQFMLAAPPIIYYGTEIAMTHEHAIEAAGFGGDALARLDMRWDDHAQDADLRDFYRCLIAFRHAHPVLRHGFRRTVYLDPAGTALVYTRTAEPGAYLVRGDLLVAFNLDDAAQALRVPARTQLPPGVVFQIGEEPAGVVLDDYQITITVPARSGIVIEVGTETGQGG